MKHSYIILITGSIIFITGMVLL